ncbi:hypothetical protein JOM56_008083 [Amanita muscaria]
MTKGSEDSEDKKPEAADVQPHVIFTVAAFVPDEASSRHRWQRWILVLTRMKIWTPSFKTNFPYLSRTQPDYGSKLPRPAGGPLAYQDFYESQGWKEHPGVGNVLLWCLKHFEIWHLLIPPITTMLDDYEAKYKLVGIGIVREMLKTVPGFLLKWTGVSYVLSFAHPSEKAYFDQLADVLMGQWSEAYGSTATTTTT